MSDYTQEDEDKFVESLILAYMLGDPFIVDNILAGLIGESLNDDNKVL